MVFLIIYKDTFFSVDVHTFFVDRIMESAHFVVHNWNYSWRQLNDLKIDRSTYAVAVYN